MKSSRGKGLKDFPDSDTDANLRGFAIRFILAEDGQKKHCDIITNTAPGFCFAYGWQFPCIVQGHAEQQNGQVLRRDSQAPMPVFICH